MANRLMLSEVVPESLFHIINPVAEQALKYVIEKLGYTYLFKDNIIITSDFRSYTKTTDANKAATVRVNRVLAKLNPNVNPSTIKWEGSGTTKDLANGNQIVQNRNGQTAQRFPWNHGNHITDMQYSIFSDDEYGIDMFCKSVGSSLSLEVTMELEDEHVAIEALSRIYQCFHNGDMIGTIDIMYDYPIPEDVHKVLAYLYSLRGKKTEDETIYKWLTEHSNSQITHVFNRNRPENVEVVVDKNHFQALYLIECSQDGPTNLEPKGGAITFTLTIQYARANRVAIQYPVVVNNEYVHPNFVPMERKIRAAGPTSMIMWDNQAVTGYWHECNKKLGPPPPVMFPYWDPWMMPTDCRANLHGYHPVLIAAFTLDDIDNPEGVTKFDFDADVAGALGCKLHDLIIDCIHKKKNLCFGSSEFVNITVFADDIAVEDELLDLSDGHTLIIKNRYRTPIYRLAISINPFQKNGPYHWNLVWICSITTFNKERKEARENGIRLQTR